LIWTHPANTVIAVFLLALSLFVLLHSQALYAETGSGMINRAPLEKAAPVPTELEKISNDLDDIIKSINEVSEEESTILIAEPKKSTAKKPVPVIAKPKKILPVPVKVKTAKKSPEKKAVKPAIAKAKKPVTVKPAIQVSFFKFNDKGEKLQSDAALWSCTEDVKSGLMWEVKSDNNDIQDKDHLYSWFDSSNKDGLTDGGHCRGDISCDTNAYVQAMNKIKLCGHDDWRLPTRHEMQSLIYFGKKKTGARINSEYFPQAMASWYWTASSNKDNPGYAWYVLFKNGLSLNDLKERPKHIRLVRTGEKA